MNRALFFIIMSLLLAACGAAPTPEPGSPGALAYDREAARQDLAVAQTRDAVSARLEKAATANAQATDRALAQRATATEQAFVLAQRQAEARATQEAVALAATANAQFAAQTAQAASARATQSALDTRATADAREIAQAMERRAATATAQAIDLAQQAARDEAVRAARTAEWSATITPIIVLIIVCAVMLLMLKFAMQWMDLRYEQRKSDILRMTLAAMLLETRVGTVVFVGDQRSGYTPQLLSTQHPPPNHDAPSEVAEAETIRVRTARGIVEIPKSPLRDEQSEANRRLALRLLRASIQKAGAQSNRVPGWRELGWPSADTWQRAKSLLSDYLISSAGQGTFCASAEYQNLHALYRAVGERRIALTPLPH